LAVFILAALALGAFKMAPMPNTDPMKSEALRAHMTGGLVILVLMLLRLITSRATLHPPAASAGARALDRLARISHRALYVLVITMALSGLTMGLQAGITPLLVGAHPSIPPDFWVFPIRRVHYLISRALIVLITLHLAGALYHTFIRRDGLLARMALGKRFAAPGMSVTERQ
jgi:cytochrome b561